VTRTSIHFSKEKFAHHQLRSLLDEGKASEDDPWEKMLLSGLCQLHAEAPGWGVTTVD
jgi:hypothetical protein